MDVGADVRAARVQAGLTQADLALRAGTTQAAISRLECGGISPTVDSLERVFAVLGLRLRLVAEPFDAWTDDDHLRDAARRTPSERIDHAVASMAGVADLVGAARHA